MVNVTLQSNIGKTGLLAPDRRGLRFAVKIVDTKNSYGNERYLIEPVAGEGRAWVDARNVEIEEG